MGDGRPGCIFGGDGVGNGEVRCIHISKVCPRGTSVNNPVTAEYKLIGIKAPNVTAGGASHVTPPEIVAIAYFSTKGNCAYFIKARNDRACAIGAAAEAVAAACEGARVAAAGWVG